MGAASKLTRSPLQVDVAPMLACIPLQVDIAPNLVRGPLQVGIAPVVARGPLQVVVISTLVRATQLVALASSELTCQALPLAPAVKDLIQHPLPAESLLQSAIMQSRGSTSRFLSCMFLVLLDALHPET